MFGLFSNTVNIFVGVSKSTHVLKRTGFDKPVYGIGSDHSIRQDFLQ